MPSSALQLHYSNMDYTSTKRIPKHETERVKFDMEEDSELFEIDLEVVDNIPPPCYCWDGYAMTTTDALLANCLLPATDLSSAVPVLSRSKAIDDHELVSFSFMGLSAKSILLTEMQMTREVAEQAMLQALRRTLSLEFHPWTRSYVPTVKSKLSIERV